MFYSQILSTVVGTAITMQKILRRIMRWIPDVGRGMKSLTLGQLACGQRLRFVVEKNQKYLTSRHTIARFRKQIFNHCLNERFLMLKCWHFAWTMGPMCYVCRTICLMSAICRNKSQVLYRNVAVCGWRFIIRLHQVRSVESFCFRPRHSNRLKVIGLLFSYRPHERVNFHLVH